MYKRLPEGDDLTVNIDFEGQSVAARPGDTVAAAILVSGAGHTRTTPVTGAPRLPYCMMGVCFECLMEIDGVPNQQACLVEVRDGMQVKRQVGARGVDE